MAFAAHAQGVSRRSAALVQKQSSRSMATLKEVEGRIKSTANIAKITKAMQMVAAAKLRGAETRLKNSRPLMAMINEHAESITLDVSKKTTLVPISTDRGLCGGVNTNIVKKLRLEEVPNEEAAGATVDIICVGDKGRGQINRFLPQYLRQTVSGIFAQVLPNFHQASAITEQVLATDAEKYSVVYNKFFSAVSQVPTKVEIPSGNALRAMEQNPYIDYETEKATDELYDNLAEFNLATTIYAALSESQCSEIASKMAAMDNATRNCDSLVERLQISYNKARQSIITTELIEIISGAESLKG